MNAGPHIVARGIAVCALAQPVKSARFHPARSLKEWGTGIISKIVWRCNCRAINLHWKLYKLLLLLPVVRFPTPKKNRMHDRLNTLCLSSGLPIYLFFFFGRTILYLPILCSLCFTTWNLLWLTLNVSCV